MMETVEQAPAMMIAPMPSGARKGGRRSGGGKRGSKKKLRKVTRPYEMLIRRALRCTFNKHGQEKKTLVKFIKNRYDLGKKGCRKLQAAMYKLLCNGYIYRNRFGPLKFKLTMKGYKMKQADLIRKKKAKKRKAHRQKRRVVRKQRRAKRATKKRKTVC